MGYLLSGSRPFSFSQPLESAMGSEMSSSMLSTVASTKVEVGGKMEEMIR